jgi:hypothetical protein
MRRPRTFESARVDAAVILNLGSRESLIARLTIARDAQTCVAEYLRVLEEVLLIRRELEEKSEER